MASESRKETDEVRSVVLKLLAWFKNSKNNGQKQEVDDWKAACQTIKSGGPLLAD